jgi:hypothetical protein
LEDIFPINHSESGNSAAVGKPDRKLKSSIFGFRFLMVEVVAITGLAGLEGGAVFIEQRPR